MSETNKSDITRTKGYFIFLMIILSLVNMLDSITTVTQSLILSSIAQEFLSDYSANEQNAIMALGASITTLGFYFIFIAQYLADKIGRKKILALTAFGMGFMSLLVMLSTNYVQYVIFTMFLCFFFSSDIFVIYAQEESKKEKRAFNYSLIQFAGLGASIFAVIMRFIFITDTSSNWRVLFIIPSIMGIALCIIILLTLKETEKYEIMKEDPSKIEKSSFREDVKALFQIENRKPFITMLLITFIFGLATLWKGLGEKFLFDAGTLTQSQISIALMLTVPAVLIAYGSNGFLADKIGRKPLLFLWTCVVPIGTIILVIGINDPNNAFFFTIIGIALLNVGFWGLFTLSRLVTIEMLPTDKRGTGTGLRALCFAVGTTIGLLIGALFILFFGLGIVFLIFSLAMFIILPLIYFSLKETKGVELSEIK